MCGVPEGVAEPDAVEPAGAGDNGLPVRPQDVQNPQLDASLGVQGKEVTDGLGWTQRLDRFLCDVGARDGLPDGAEERGVEPVGVEANVSDLLQPVVLDCMYSITPSRSDDPLTV